MANSSSWMNIAIPVESREETHGPCKQLIRGSIFKQSAFANYQSSVVVQHPSQPASNDDDNDNDDDDDDDDNDNDNEEDDDD